MSNYSSDNTEEGFYVVWNPEGDNPQVRHTTMTSAIGEAERLARVNPGKTFIVLETVALRRVDNMQRVKFIAPVPF